MSISDRSPSPHPVTRLHGQLLWFLTFLFFLRVLGQALVTFLHVSFLPPMKEWFSGLLPYPGLLASQILILLLQCKINSDFTVGQGYFVERKERGGRFLRWFSYVYAGSMAIRYVITMSLYPERRWLGTGTIPIFFHFVLAAYLFTFAHFHTRPLTRKPVKPAGDGQAHDRT